MDMTPILAVIPAQYAVYVSAAVGLCALVATILPPPAVPASGWYPVVYHLVNILGANVLKARNAADPTRPIGTAP